MIDAQISENFRTLKMLGKYKSVRQLSETLNIDIRDVRKVINGNTRNSRNRTVFEAILQKLGVSQTEFSQMRAAVTHPISVLPMKSNTLQPVPDLGPIASIEDIPVSDSNRTFVCKMEAGTLQPFILPGDILYFERKELQIFPLPAPAAGKRPSPTACRPATACCRRASDSSVTCGRSCAASTPWK